MLDLTGKVALVLGCGAVADGWGNGRATTVLLARQGATVLGTDLVLPHAENTLECIRNEGKQASVMACDATDSSQVRAAVKHCVQQHGRIDILVNNVGVSMRGGPEDMDEETWNAQLQVNLTSAFLSCKYVIPHMRDQGGGAIVNVSSVAGLRYIGKPQVAYAAAKAGLLQFTHTSAVIHAHEGIRFNCVVPGLMNTPLIEGLAQKYAGGDTEGFIASRHNQVPMGHMGTGWDTAHAVLFLVSDESRYITGTEIIVDGGLVAATR